MNIAKGALLNPQIQTIKTSLSTYITEVTFDFLCVRPEALEETRMVLSNDFVEARKTVPITPCEVCTILYQKIKTVKFVQVACKMGWCPSMTIFNVHDLLRIILIKVVEHEVNESHIII